MITAIKITGEWVNYTYYPVSKRDNGIKFLKAIRKCQLSRAKKEEVIWMNKYRERGRYELLHPQNIGLRIEILH